MKTKVSARYLLLWLFFVISVVLAGCGKPIIPGEGVGDIRIGMQSQAVIKQLGPGFQRTEYAEEETKFQRFGYRPCQNLQFYIGFDYLISYTPEGNRTTLPVWKLYFKDDRLVYMIISGFVYPQAVKQGYAVRSKMNFDSNRARVIQVLGKPDLVFTDPAKNINLFYFNTGIKVMLVPIRKRVPGYGGPKIISLGDARARAMHLFRPLNTDQAREYKQRIREGCK